MRFNSLAWFTRNLISESIRASMNCSFAKVSVTSPGAVGWLRLQCSWPSYWLSGLRQSSCCSLSPFLQLVSIEIILIWRVQIFLQGHSLKVHNRIPERKTNFLKHPEPDLLMKLLKESIFSLFPIIKHGTCIKMRTIIQPGPSYVSGLIYDWDIICSKSPVLSFTSTAFSRPDFLRCVMLASGSFCDTCNDLGSICQKAILYPVSTHLSKIRF